MACAMFVVASPTLADSVAPFDIICLQAMTGSLAFVGESGAAALAAYETYFNKTGGINGRPIHFVIEDAQTNPSVALQLLNEANASHPAIVMGPSSAAECNAVFATTKNGPVVWCYSSAVNAEPGSYNFQSSATNFDYNSAAIRWLRGRGLTRLALITPTDATGQTYDRAIAAILQLPENHAVTLVEHEHFNPGDVSVSAQISKIQASRAQVIIVGTAGSAAGTVFHGIADAGLTLPAVTGNGNSTQAFMKQYASILPKELYVESTSCLAPAEIANKAEKAAYETYVAAMAAHGTPVDCLQSTAWDPALMVTTALRHVGTNATAEQLRTYIANMQGVAGVNGIYDFKRVPQRGIDDHAVIIMRWDKDTTTWIPVSKPGGVAL
jgi:branched-chain amino acid transport system substrate-binding protein